LLVKQWKESNLRKSIAGKTVEREQPGKSIAGKISGKTTTYVKVLLVKQWKESNLRKSSVDKTVERELPT
jgi:hypothetical protein